jgi:sec-independent protein translocase protein TatB
MEILGIGFSELVFILLVAIIILGPKDMQKAGRTIGRWLNQIVRSDGWKVFQKTSTEIRNLPRNLMREANMEMGDVEKEIREIRQTIDPRPQPPAPSRRPPPLNKAEGSPQPPAVSPTDAGRDTDQDE